jgi:hypothetical protein
MTTGAQSEIKAPGLSFAAKHNKTYQNSSANEFMPKPNNTLQMSLSAYSDKG